MELSTAIIERHELKYRIPPALVPAVRQAIARYCVPDPSSRGEGGYLISSLYLDSPDLVLYRMTRDDRPRRFKLRIRRYVDGPFFLEVKRKEKDVIVKTRVAVPATSWPDVLLTPDHAQTLGLGAREQRNLQDFVDRASRVRAEPTTIVQYAREAYVSLADDYGRVTFDHRLCGRTPSGWEIPIGEIGPWIAMDLPARFGLPVSGVVMELKCTTAIPLWMSDLVRRFGVQRAGFSKYCTAVDAVRAFPSRDPLMLNEPAPWLRRVP